MKKFLFILFIFISANCLSQSIPEDAGSYISATINKKLDRNWSISLEEELRLFDNISRINAFFTNVGISYKIREYKFLIAYRFINKNEDDMFYSKTHRFYGEASYKYKWNDWALSYRFRMQGQYSQVNSSETGKSITSYMRHKFALSYSLDKFSPYTAVEFRQQLTNPKFPESKYLVNRTGYFLGVDYDFNRMHSIGVYYLFLHYQNVKLPEYRYIFGLEYTLNL